MTAVSRLGRQISEVTAVLRGIGARFALIGGLALASHNVVRATQDVDLLVDAEMADRIDAALINIGYRCLHRSADAGNYLRNDERVDFLYASRPIARRLLAGGTELKTSFGDLRVVSASVAWACGVRVQPERPADPYRELDDLMAVVEQLCPRWPERDVFRHESQNLL